MDDRDQSRLDPGSAHDLPARAAGAFWDADGVPFHSDGRSTVSTTLEGPLDWPDATVVSGDAVDVVTWLKEESDVPCARTAACP